MNAFKITYDQLLEEGLTLTVKYPDGKNEYASDKRTFGKIQGYYADAEVDVTGSEGGFLKYLTSVVLDEDVPFIQRAMKEAMQHIMRYLLTRRA